MDVSVYLADLRHDYSGVLANDCMPLGVAYMKAVLDRDLPEARSRLFAYPGRLWDALREAPPDVLMLSNYMWNEDLSFQFAKLAKRVNPDMLVVMGGPNISLEDERKVEYLRARPWVDVYVLGEGDFLAREVVREYLAAGKSLARLHERTIPSSIHRRPDGEYVVNKLWDRQREVDEIPSPWLSGALDEFFDGRLAPMIETNRGCPFTCTFCVQGIRWYAKVHYFGKERLRQEIEYIAARVHADCPNMGTLRIADSNYGMFERDAEISEYIGRAQAQYGWPTFIDATTGKNRPERIIESLERMNGALVLYQAVQSLDDDALKNIKRSNIRKEAYEQIMIHVRGRGLRSLSDLILGLPGETLASHIQGIHSLLDAGTHEMHNFQSMMLKGSEMETLKVREEFGFTTRHRVLPKNFGVYAGDKVFDTDEIVVATDSLPFEHYLEARIYHLACSIFWNNSWFEDAVAFAHVFGVKPSRWIDAMVSSIKGDEGAVRKLLDDFVRETTQELFPTREACLAFYQKDENFERLRQGEIGDNLMYKYRALASFFVWPEIARGALEATYRLVVDEGAREQMPGFEEFWPDFARYVEARHAHGGTPESLLTGTRTTLRHDVAGWLAAGLPKDLTPFRLAVPLEVEFSLSDEGRRELEAALQTWGTSLKGLTKGVTRIRTAAQLRECRMMGPAAAA